MATVSVLFGLLPDIKPSNHNYYQYIRGAVSHTHTQERYVTGQQQTCMRLAVSSSPRPWIDVFTLPEKSRNPILHLPEQSRAVYLPH